MFSIAADSGAVSLVAHPTCRGIALIALAAAIVLGGTQVAVAQTATEQQATTEQQTTTEQQSAAQQSSIVQPSKWEFLVASGVLSPTGAQREVIRQADITIAQLSYVVRANLAITAAVGWARARDIATVGNPRLDIFTYDVGAEFRPIQWLAGRAVNFSPFAGGGVGARTYDYRGLEVDATHNIAGYVSAGGDFAWRRVHSRFEVRDYVTDFQSLNSEGSSGARNDVVAMIGLRIAGR